MKKKIFPVLTLISLLTCGCGSVPTSSQNTTTISTETLTTTLISETSEVPSSSISEITTSEESVTSIITSEVTTTSEISITSEESTTSIEEFVVDDNTKLTTILWNDKVDKMIQYSCGDAANLFPHLKGESYYTYIENIDGIRCTVMNVYVKSLTDVIENYETTLDKNQFVVSGENYYAYHIYKEINDAVVQYTPIEDIRKPYVELIFYTATTRSLEFDMDLVETVLGREIPVLKASSYSAYFDGYNMMGSIYANNVSYNEYTQYHKDLIATGDFILKENTAYGNTYISMDGYSYLDLSLSYDEYGRDSILIRFKNNWPRVEIMSYLGGLDIPKYSDVYYEGCFESFYLDLNQDGTEDVFEIAFDGVTKDEYESYASKYITDGWVLDPDSGSTNKWFTQEVNVNGVKTTYEVGVLYGKFEGYDVYSIAVVIYL